MYIYIAHIAESVAEADAEGLFGGEESGPLGWTICEAA